MSCLLLSILLVDSLIITIARFLFPCTYLPLQIVFDSPCKTYEEIREALISGVTLNANTFNEVYKVP